MTTKPRPMRRYEVTGWGQSYVIVAKNAGAAKWLAAVVANTACRVEQPGEALKHLKCRSLGLAGTESRYVKTGAAWASEVDPKRDAQDAADHWNAAHPIGTPVRYWTWLREGDGKTSKTRTLAQSMGSHASVWVDGEASCISLTHVEAI